MLPESFDMPSFRDPDGTVWVWDAESSSYVQKPNEGLEQDRGHSTGGDNDLFNQNQIEHSELAGVPELEGYMAHVREAMWPFNKIPLPCPYFGENGRVCGGALKQMPDGTYQCQKCNSSLGEGNLSDNTPGDMTLADMGIPPSSEDYFRTAAEWAPEGQVLCPQCREATHEHVCPTCGKDLTPEWNQEADKNNEFMGVHPPHDNTTEHHSFPDVEPKRNRMKTDDSYPSMSLSKTAVFGIGEGAEFVPPSNQVAFNDFVNNVATRLKLVHGDRPFAFQRDQRQDFDRLHDALLNITGGKVPAGNDSYIRGDRMYAKYWNGVDQVITQLESQPHYQEIMKAQIPVKDIRQQANDDQIAAQHGIAQRIPTPSVFSYSTPVELSTRIARKLAYKQVVGQDEWDDLFAGGGKVEIGKWMLDRNGQFHFDHGMHANHEAIAARDGLRYPDDVAALGSVYNDGLADTQRVFPGAQFNLESVQAQINQAFGPVTLSPPVGQQQSQTKGVAFEPMEITGGQWVIAPAQAAQPITGTAWIKGVTQTPYNPNTEILVAEHLQPEDIDLWQNGVKAIITATGGLTSHAAYLASTQGVPVVVGIGPAYNKIESGNYLKIDPQRQVITVMPGADASMSPDQKQQISDAYINYQMQHGGNHLGESPEWIKITTATLDNCPECSDVMHDQDGESVCHGCGHKQPIIVSAAVLAPLGEAAIGGLADMGAGAAGAGAAEGGAGLMGGSGGISGIGSLMQKALSGNPLQDAYYGDRLMGGGGHGEQQPAAPEEVGTDPSAMQGVISYWKDAHTAGVIGDILESIVNALQKAPEAFTDPKSPLSYADDAMGAAAQLGQQQSPTMASVWHYAEFGDEEVGTATKNRGENSDPDQESSSGDSSKEHGDSPEQLKDVDGPGDAKGDAFPEDDLKAQGDPALQDKALKSLHMNMPLVIEFAESDEPGSENPILVALDQLLEEAFPGYKDGHESPEEVTTEHPQESDGEDKSEDESGNEPDDGDSKDKKEDVKEASVWHMAFEPMAPAAPAGAPAAMPDQMNQAMAPVCPYCGQTHAPGTACPQEAAGAALAAPTAVGAPITPAQPNKVVTKWEVVALEEPHHPVHCMNCGWAGDASEADYTDDIDRLADWGRPGLPEDERDQAVNELDCPQCGGAIDHGHAPAFDHAEVAPQAAPQPDPYAAADEARIQQEKREMFGSFDAEFGFFTASDEHHEEHEAEHKPEDDDDSNSTHDATDGDGVEKESHWVDEAGTPLQEGADYEMKASSYAIPDRVTIERILPDKITYTLHTGDVDYQDEVTKEQLDVDGVSFAPVGGEAPYDSEDGFQDYTAPTRPGQDATPQVDDLSTPSTVMSSTEFEPISLDNYTGSFRGDAPDDRSWLMEGGSSAVEVDPALMAKLAGKDFSPREQREFIEEKGSARNLDRLQLEGTHYVLDEVDAHFNW